MVKLSQIFYPFWVLVIFISVLGISLAGQGQTSSNPYLEKLAVLEPLPLSWPLVSLKKLHKEILDEVLKEKKQKQNEKRR